MQLSRARFLFPALVVLSVLVLATGASATNGTFTVVGPGSPCANGVTPTLTGAGTLAGGSLNSLTIAGGPAFGPCLMVVGFAPLNLPFKGGIMGPHPSLVLPSPLNGLGGSTVTFTWPAGIPAGTMVWVQVWCPDATITGWCSSNTLKITSR